MARTSERLAVFDFDNTIVSGDTGTKLAVSLIVQNPLRLAAALLLAPVALPLFIGETTRRHGISFFYWAATVGRSEEDWRRSVREFVEHYLSKPRVFVEALQALEEHRKKGDPIVVATGSFELLAGSILRDGLGFDVEIVASEIRKVLGGHIFGEHCFGANKLAMVRRRVGERELTYVYSDSSFDLALLSAAKNRFLVNASRMTERLVRKHAGSFQRLVWRDLVPLTVLEQRGNVPA